MALWSLAIEEEPQNARLRLNRCQALSKQGKSGMDHISQIHLAEAMALRVYGLPDALKRVATCLCATKLI